MYLEGVMIFKQSAFFLSLFIFGIFLQSCGLADYTTNIEQSPPPASTLIRVKNPYLPSDYGNFHPEIGYSDLSPVNSAGSAPIIRLNSSDQLRLILDVLKNDVPVLGVRFKHHQPNWQDSGLPLAMILEGNSYEILQDQQNSSELGPLYRSYELKFPSKNLKFKFSGNYSLEVFNPSNGHVWARLPFFISEALSGLTMSVEQIYASSTTNRIVHQPFLVYKYPDFVQFPISQVSAYFVKNQFWGRSIKADRIDQNIQGELGFHPSRNRSFVADEQIRSVSLSNPTPDNFRILEVDRPNNILKVILQRDTPGLDANNSRSNIRRSMADNSKDAEYLDAQFQLETDLKWQNAEVYLLGDFNQWAIDKRYKLISDKNADFPFLTAQVRIKEGNYGYKYVVKYKNGEIDDRPFMTPFTNFTNIYHSLVYYKDPELQIYRLLNTHQISVSE